MENDVYEIPMGKKLMREFAFFAVCTALLSIWELKNGTFFRSSHIHRLSPKKAVLIVLLGAPLTFKRFRIDRYGIRITYLFLFHRRVLWAEIRSFECIEENVLLVVLNGAPVPSKYNEEFMHRHPWRLISIPCDSKEDMEKHLQAIEAIRQKYSGTPHKTGESSPS